MAKYKIIPSSRTIVQSPISIGHKAEKGVEAIEFDLTAWVETYGSGTATIVMKRWGDSIPYPVALEIDENNKATWVLSDTDTARAGMAYAQLSYIVGETVVKKSDIYTFRVMDSLTGEGDPPEAYESWLEHLTHLAAEAMAEVLDIEGIVTDKTLTVDGGIADAKAAGDALALKADKSTTYTKTEVDQMIEDVEVETDTTLTISGAPADAKKTGDELSALKADLDDLDDRVTALEEGGGGGMTDNVKTALMNLVNHLAWDDDDPTGQTYITALQNALYPPADLVSITAVYTQSGTVYDTDTLDSLKSDLVVTALMSDSTTQTVTNYTLSGTLTEGTSTITVSYGGKTTTFTVTVSHEAIYVKNLVEEGTLLREHAWGTNGTSTNPSWIPSVYSISDVRSGDVLILPNGWNSANWKLVRNIGTVDGSDSIPDCTQGESWVQYGNDYGYYTITMNEDVETLYVSFYPTYGNVATWTREGGF